LEKWLHIISLDVPYPANYGGVYDLFYKLPALQQQGVNILLHCFYKDRGEQTELNKYCKEVFYYERNTGPKGLSTRLPYIVASRCNENLLQRLLLDKYPVLMEGVHCTYLTMDKRFETRKKFVRVHNVEHEYYSQLMRFSHNFRKKIYYWRESKLLANYEKRLVNKAKAFWPVTPKDSENYRRELGCKSVAYLPLFIPNWSVNGEEGMGTYCLYHGNLEVEENQYTVTWLLKHVFPKLEIPLVIAGKNPSKKIADLVKTNKHACLIANPEEPQMQDIISKAHIHVLPSFSSTGIKIKLLNALYNGRHCIVNNANIAGTVLTETCHEVNTANEFKERILLLYHQPFTTEEKKFRRQILENEFSNEKNAKQIVEWIWEKEV
jgi:hypothetical protein